MSKSSVSRYEALRDRPLEVALTGLDPARPAGGAASTPAGTVPCAAGDVGQPAQAGGAGHCWSLGMMLMQVLTGEHALQAPGRRAAMTGHSGQTPLRVGLVRNARMRIVLRGRPALVVPGRGETARLRLPCPARSSLGRQPNSSRSEPGIIRWHTEARAHLHHLRLTLPILLTPHQALRSQSDGGMSALQAVDAPDSWLTVKIVSPANFPEPEFLPRALLPVLHPQPVVIISSEPRTTNRMFLTCGLTYPVKAGWRIHNQRRH